MGDQNLAPPDRAFPPGGSWASTWTGRCSPWWCTRWWMKAMVRGGPHLFSRLHRAGQSPLLLPGDSSSVPEPPRSVFSCRARRAQPRAAGHLREGESGAGAPPSPPVPSRHPLGAGGSLGRRWGCFGVVPKLEGSSPVFTPLFSPPQHADGTFCVKPLKQKQVVSAPRPQGAAGTPGRSGDPRGPPPHPPGTVAGGRGELPAAGDLRHREQVQHAGLQGRRPMGASKTSLDPSPSPSAPQSPRSCRSHGTGVTRGEW